jgi:hypothetical protein
MEVSRGTAYGLGLSQALGTIALVLFLPEPVMQAFTVQAENVNGTLVLVGPKGPISSTVSMGLPVLLVSLMAAVFTSLTYRMHEEGLSGLDFQSDTVEQLAMWDLVFWCHCLGVHCVVVGLLTSPANAFGWLSSTCFMVYFLFRICTPKAQTTNMTQENLNLLGYFLGVMQVGYQIPPVGQSHAVTVVMCMVVLDYFLGVGHTWDRQATMDTVTNCRLFYVMCAAVGIACLYALAG